MLVTEAAGEIQHIIDIGVDFDKDENGQLDRTLEGGHSRRRIFHHKDSTGAEVTAKIRAAVLARKNITVVDNALLCRMKKISGGFAGSNWELTRARVDDLKDRQYHVREMEELFK